MKRALVIGLLALSGCDWQGALKSYEMRIVVPDASAAFPNGHNCGVNADCQSNQCRVGVCIVDVPVGNGPISCGDDDDCGSESRDGGRVCEPGSTAAAGAYVCTPFTSCGKTGRVCLAASDCFDPAGGCGSACVDGRCKVLTCGREEADAGCAVQSDCCSGSLCSGPVADGGIVPGTGHCLLSAPNVLPMDALCTASDQCGSKYCNTGVPRTCTNPLNLKLGETCGATCNSGLVCDNGRCFIEDRRGCVLDSSCRTGQCLAGFCSPRTDTATQARICRQLALTCGDDNDCCTGLCDAAEKQCTLTPKLLDGGTCTVDPITQECRGAATCVGASGQCTGDAPCCNGMTCSNGTCF